MWFELGVGIDVLCHLWCWAPGLLWWTAASVEWLQQPLLMSGYGYVGQQSELSDCSHLLPRQCRF